MNNYSDLYNELPMETKFRIESWILSISKAIDIDKDETMKLLKDIFIMYEVKINIMTKLYKEQTEQIISSYYDHRKSYDNKE